MRPYILLIALLSLCAISDAQDFSNKGKEFWLGYGNHQQMSYPTASSWPGMDIYITSDVNTTVTVDIPGLGISLGTHNVVANQITTIRNVPSAAFLDEEGISNNGIHIVAGRPVVVYAFIYFSSVSGATLCLPVSTLGREYYSVNFTQQAQITFNPISYSYFFVVATEDNSTIEIKPTANSVSNNLVAGQTYTQVLNKGQVFNMLSRTDLTGSIVRSVNNGSGCKKIAVFCGSGRIGIGCDPNPVISSDNLFQQMYPNGTWGKKYLTTPSASRPLNYYRIIRPDPTTQVKLDGQLVPAASFTNNFYYQFSDREPHLIEGDKPILVAQYFTTQKCAEQTDNGDPEMIYLNPVEQTINKVTLTSMQLANQLNVAHFLNVVVKNSPAAINSFKLDGVGYASEFTPHPADRSFAYARLQVQQGAHTMTCDTAFNAIAYGFAQTESYGYSAGTNLKDLYQFISVQNEGGTVNAPAACMNAPFRLAITFPYQPTQIQWIFGPALNALGFRDSTINNPVADSSWVVDGRTLYQYRLAKSYQITTRGTYTITLRSINPSSLNGCSGEQENEYYLEMFERPKAGATVTNSGCLTDDIVFKDQSDAKGRSLVGWYWNMNDNTAPRTEKDVTYQYAAAGDYQVLHAAISDMGCMSDTIPLNVKVTSPPIANLSLITPGCEDKDLTFRSQTASGGDPITQWLWDFGDGSAPLNATNGNNVTHTYTNTGPYKVSLQVSTSAGCKSEIKELPVNIHPSPVVDFEFPEVCVDDAFAPFTDKTTIADNSEAGFIRFWSFGDGGSSTVANPQHKYAAAGNYTVELIVTSNNNCAASLTKPITVNGAVKDAAFQVDNAAALCAGQDVVIRDASTVDFGNLTKVVIYWDYDADPTNKTEDEDAAIGKNYSHKYPAFNTPPDRTYRIVYEAYSGMTCFKSQEQRITIKPSPQLVFDALTPVCEEVTPFRITTARALPPSTGTGVFSGDGIDADGLFHPGRAGARTHTLTYTFTDDNGCRASIDQQIIVHPTPLADAGPDKGVLSGGSITLQGRGEGNQVSILWSPVTAMQGITSPTPSVSPVEDIRYTLMVTSADGCKAQDEVLVKVLKQPVIPNAFSPNGDGINDNWIILYLDSYPGCSVDVFNRYGQKVFHSTGYGKPWDGTMNGSPLPVGTYYWIVNPRNGRPVEKGAVTIIR